MGYTHYFNRKPTLDLDLWQEFIPIVQSIVNSEAHDISLDYEITDEHVQLDGVGKDGYETLYIPRIYTPKEWQEPDNNGTFFGCCKTNRRPYDSVVTAILLAANSVFRDDLTIASDGFAQEWYEGYRLLLKAYPYMDYVHPNVVLDLARISLPVEVEVYELLNNNEESFIELLLEAAGDPKGREPRYTLEHMVGPNRLQFRVDFIVSHIP